MILHQTFRFFRQFGFLDVQVRINFRNVIFIPCKWCKICKYYVNSMVISWSTIQKEDKECIWVKYLIYAVLLQCKICRIVRAFSAKSVFPKLQSSQKNVFFSKSALSVSSVMQLIKANIQQKICQMCPSVAKLLQCCHCTQCCNSWKPTNGRKLPTFVCWPRANIL